MAPQSPSRPVTLTVRDSVVLRWIGEMGAVETGGPGVGLLDWLLGVHSPEASHPPGPVRRRTRRDWLTRMGSHKLVSLVRVGGTEMVRLTLHGARMMEVPWHAYALTAWGVPHTSAVGQVRFFLEGHKGRRDGGGNWLPESSLRKGLGYPEGTKRPDGVWVSTSGNYIGIEVELNRKTRFQGQYQDLMTRAHPALDSVWWFVPTETDKTWLAPRVAGAGVSAAVELLPFLHLPELHPQGCGCYVCEWRRMPIVAAWARGEL